VNPEINALASIILGVVGIVGFIAWYLMARAKNSVCVISSVQDAAEGFKISSDVPRTTRHCFSGK
jgi:putrescine transport system permease protein